jgi:hypothetical protein
VMELISDEASDRTELREEEREARAEVGSRVVVMVAPPGRVVIICWACRFWVRLLGMGVGKDE